MGLRRPCALQAFRCFACKSAAQALQIAQIHCTGIACAVAANLPWYRFEAHECSKVLLKLASDLSVQSKMHRSCCAKCCSKMLVPVKHISVSLQSAAHYSVPVYVRVQKNNICYYKLCLFLGRGPGWMPPLAGLQVLSCQMWRFRIGLGDDWG